MLNYLYLSIDIVNEKNWLSIFMVRQNAYLAVETSLYLKKKSIPVILMMQALRRIIKFG